MASLCREFGISRVTGYKIYERYKECGLEGLTDRARTPYRYANKLPVQLEAMIVTLRREKPTWALASLGNACCANCPTMFAYLPAAPSMHHGPPWAGDSTKALSHNNRRYAFIRRTRSERLMVHRLQGRVHARR